MRKFKHIPTGEEWKLNGAGGILPVNNYTNYSLPLWVTVNSKDWEEIKEKEWEILLVLIKLMYYMDDNGERQNYSYTLRPNGYYIEERLSDSANTKYTLEEMTHLFIYEIKSVRRLSDGEVFTVGDNTSSGVIVSFDINSTIMNVVFGPNMHSICNSGFAKIKKEPLFTTEDGVEIFEGDTIFSVEHTYYKIDDKIAGIYKGSNKNHPVEHWYNDDKYFSTKEAAEKYIIMYKPVLSIKDLLKNFSLANAAYKGDFFNNITMDELKELAKSKL